MCILRYLYISCLVFFLLGCSPSSLEEYHLEGEDLVCALANELQSIQTADDLSAKSSVLKKYFHNLVDLANQARAYQMQETTGSAMAHANLSDAASLHLQQEMIRIYQIDGCQTIMESLQRDSLHKLILDD